MRSSPRRRRAIARSSCRGRACVRPSASAARERLIGLGRRRAAYWPPLRSRCTSGGMLELRYVVDHLPEVRAALLRRGQAAAASLQTLGELAEKRRDVIGRLEALRKQQNEANQAMAALDKQSTEFRARRDALKAIAQQSKPLEAEQRALEQELEQALLLVPNLPSAQTPDGKDESDNVLVHEFGSRPQLGFAAKEHVELGAALGI